jgi:hypothetical protein
VFAFEIAPGGSVDTGRCECCGNLSRRVWGYAAREGEAYASYFVHWTLGHVPEFGAYFDLIVGRWGEGTTSAGRCAVSLDYRLLESGPGFMVIDADKRDIAKNELVGRALKRIDVIGQPLAEHIFALCDAILAEDRRLAELIGESADDI